MIKEQKLTKAQKLKLRKEVSDKTLEASLNLLNESGKCMVIRPTGFGKSYMLARISNKYNKSLYVYPTNIIKQSVIKSYSPGKNNDVSLHNVDFMSYSELNNRYKDNTIEGIIDKYDIVMLDEVHMAGAAGFMTIWDIIRNKFDTDKKHLIGVTATPNRQSKTKFPDGSEVMVDVLHDIFDGHKVFKYTLRDCINSGLMQPLIYAQITYDAEALKNSIRKRIEKAQKKVENNPLAKDDMNQIIRQLFSSLNTIENAPIQIKKIITNVRGRVNYLKFIVFCSNKQDIETKRKLVTAWFEEAFQDMAVNEHIIVSKTKDSNYDYEDEIKTIEVLNTIEEENNTIDIIYCVDMLNMGYHIDNIDGIIMLRGTESEIVYFQQIGRCMSITSDKKPIVLDFVRNADVHSLFEENKKKSNKQDILNDDADEYDDKLYKNDIIIADIEDGTGSFLYKVDSAMDAIENTDERETNLICWWYTEMNAPVYNILQLMNKPITTKQIQYVIDKLKSQGISIESEKRALLNMGPQHRAALPKAYINTFNN